jgi:hypothetical protein
LEQNIGSNALGQMGDGGDARQSLNIYSGFHFRHSSHLFRDLFVLRRSQNCIYFVGRGHGFLRTGRVTETAVTRANPMPTRGGL